MNTHTDRSRQSQIVLLILLLSILFDKFCISRVAPRLSGLIGINPIPVIFGVPVDLPITLGLIPILGAFAISYFIFIFPYRHSHEVLAREQMKQKMRNVFVGIISIPICIIVSGMIYLLIHDYLPRGLRNGIESFGLNADLYLFYPANGVTHLKGGVIVLIGCLTGIYIFIRKLKSISSSADHPAWYPHPGPDQGPESKHFMQQKTSPR